MTNQADDVIDVLIDLDGTMVDFVKGWQTIWNEKHPDRMIQDPPTMHELEEAYSGFGSEEEICEIWRTPGFFLGLDPMPRAIESFNQMVASGLNLFICSKPTKQSSSWSEKVEWVEMHLGREWADRVILTKDKTMVRADYLIDDNSHISEGLYVPDWDHILFDASYNRGEEFEKRFRITWHTWPKLLLYHANK